MGWGRTAQEKLALWEGRGRGSVHVAELVPASLESDSVSVRQRIKEHAEEEGSERGFLGQKQRRGLHL